MEAVTYVCQWYHPENVGVACWVPEELHRHGWDVQVLTGVPNYPTGVVPAGYRADQASREVIGGIPVRRTPLHPSHDDSAAGRILNICSWAASSVLWGLGDVRRQGLALVYSSPVTANLAPMIARIAFGTPYVTVIQDLWPDSVFESGFLAGGPVRRVAETLLGWFARLSYALASTVVVISPSMADVLVARGVPRRKIAYVPNWVDESLFGQPVTPAGGLRASLGLSERDFVAMYAGAMGPAQGLSALIEGVARAEDTHLVMVGDGIDRPALEALVAERGIGGRVHFVGRRPMADMPAINAAADVNVVCLADTPLFRVTMPSKVPSLLAAGRPVVVVAAGDPADVVTQAEAGWAASPDDPEAVAAALRAAREAGSEERARRGENGRRTYAETMSAAVGAERLAAILRTARDGRRTRKARR